MERNGKEGERNGVIEDAKPMEDEQSI